MALQCRYTRDIVWLVYIAASSFIVKGEGILKIFISLDKDMVLFGKCL